MTNDVFNEMSNEKFAALLMCEYFRRTVANKDFPDANDETFREALRMLHEDPDTPTAKTLAIFAAGFSSGVEMMTNVAEAAEAKHPA